VPVFEYIAIDASGKQKKGSLDAENSRSARQKLRTQGVFPTEIKEGTEVATKKNRDILAYFKPTKLALKDLASSTRQLATLIGAGLPLVGALNALSEQSESGVLKRILIEVKEDVEGGLSLARALGNFPQSFPKLYINMIASGEASGTLDTVLANLADYLESQLELRRKVMSAMLYPVLMLVICTLVVVALLVFMVPRIVEMFERQGATLPLPTLIMIGISDFFINYWYLIVVLIIGIIYATKWYYKQEAGRYKLDGLFLKIPVYGAVFTKITTARATRTLSALLSSGVGLLASLEITRNIVTNVHFEQALREAQNGVREGRSLARELSKSGVFPQMLCHMIAVGESSGELEAMLSRAGKSYESEVNATLSGLTSILEPLLMVVVGFIVLCILVAALLPMAELINIVQ